MKTLFRMRHAKSSWGEPGMDDFDRPLLEKGKKRTRTIIHNLEKRKALPEFIITSPAIRALETAKIIAHHYSIPPENFRVDKQVYTADDLNASDIFFDIPNHVNSLMVVGHNPSITNFANRFIPKPVDPLPTSSVVCIKSEIGEWNDICQNISAVKFILYPKQLK
jgi:phosphohistidine phosphatase